MSSVSPSLSVKTSSEEGLEDARTTDRLMASLSAPPSTSQHPEENKDSDHRSRLEQLKSHPFFGDLQVTLALDCLQSKVPYTLLSDSTDSTKPKAHPAFCTVSDSIMEQHLDLQKTLMGVQMYFPTLLTIYHQLADQVESQRYKALTYNCHSENVKRLVNWFYDCERRLLIERIQDSVRMMTDKTTSLLPEPSALNRKSAIFHVRTVFSIVEVTLISIQKN